MQPETTRRRSRKRFLIPIVLLFVVIALVVVFKDNLPIPGMSSASPAADSVAAGEDSTLVAAADTTSGDEDGKDEEDETPVVPVEIATVVRDTVASTYTASATLEAERHVDLLAKVEATVEEIRVEEGDDVKEGEILAVLDGRELGVQVQRYQSAVEAAEAQHERVQALLDSDLAAQKQLDDALRVLDESKAMLEEATIRLSYTKIRAPFSGRVTRRMIDVGQTVAPGAQLFSLADMDPLLVRVFLPEDEILHIHEGQSVQVRLDADEELKLSGRVRQVAPVVDRQTGTVKVTVEVAEQAQKVRPGSFVRVFITTDIHPMALVLPKRCLVEETGKRYVFVVQDDSVVVRDVELGYEEADRYEIAEGLEPGDRVVMVGQGSLKEGSKIRVLNEENDNGDGAADGQTDLAEGATETAS